MKIGWEEEWEESNEEGHEHSILNPTGMERIIPDIGQDYKTDVLYTAGMHTYILIVML